MNEQPQSIDELRGLIDALCQGTISPEQMARLEVLVLADPAAEVFYVRSMALFADLRRQFVGISSVPALKPLLTRSPHRPRGRIMLIGLLAGCATLTAAMLMFSVLLPRPEPRKQPVEAAQTAQELVEPTDETVAVLAQVVGAEWNEGSQSAHVGAALKPGRLSLRAGLARLEFYCGATVILEGPAELDLVSAEKARCVRGRLHAHVPPQATGFTIEAPDVRLVDRGTEFGLSVGAEQPTEVHVFKGMVEVHDSRQAPLLQPRELTTGQAVRVLKHETDRIDADASKFVSAEDLSHRLEADVQRRQREWLVASTVLRDDPVTRFYFSFEAESDWTGTLRNRATATAGPKSDGATVGCQWTEGRWPGRSALEFKRVSDRVRVPPTGQVDSLTLLAWVRIDGLNNVFNALFMTDGFKTGECHWQIHKAGTIVLGVQGPNDANGHNYSTPVVFTPDRLGEWVHLAVVADRHSQRVTHYIDGQPVSREPLVRDAPFRLASGEIGNWNPARERTDKPVRNFNGRIDELALLARALTDDEIRRCYEAGKPR